MAKLLLGIDPGHGGTNTGKVVAVGGDLVFVEKDLTLSLANKLLAAMGPQHLMSRVSDEAVSLSDRAKRLNRANMVLSIHFDSGENESINGTRFYSISEAAQRAAVGMANALKASGRRARVIVPMESTYPRVMNVLRRHLAPAILCEVAFLTNAMDRAYVSNGCPGFVDTVSATLKGVNFA